MKKFLINMAIFFVIIAVVDFSLGKVFHYLQAHAGGRTGAEYYVCEKAIEDVIIMGSSRASHHYVPEIISKKLGMSCFNAGQDGNGIILQYGRWKMMSERYTPKLLIYDITSIFDLAVNDNMAFIDRLKPFCENKTVIEYIATLFPMEKYKIYSYLYRFNYKFIEITFDFVKGSDYTAFAGYLPEYGSIREEMKKKSIEKKQTLDVDLVKLNYLQKLALEAKNKGTQVVFVISPYWNGGDLSLNAYHQIQEFTNKNGIQFIEYISSEMCHISNFYKDSMHLNDTGSRFFTDNLVSKIVR